MAEGGGISSERERGGKAVERGSPYNLQLDSLALEFDRANLEVNSDS